MSRYQTTNKNGERFEYGYDRPLQEYFIQKVIPSNDDFPECIELVGSLSDTYGTAANLLDAIEKNGVIIPDAHREAILFDLPF